MWLTADLHLGHQFVSKLRGFADVAEHDSAIINNWEKVIRKDDQTWVLGDVALTRHDEALAIIAGLPGVKHLVAGNHDPCHPMHRESHKHQRKYLEVFDSVQVFARRKILGKTLLLSHFPYSSDRGFEARYPQYRLPDFGEWLVHGHTHLPEVWTGPREIHVGVDAWGLKPVSLDTVAKLMA